MFSGGEATYNICVSHISGSSLYSPRQFANLKVAIDNTVEDRWNSSDPIRFAKISHPRANAVSVLDSSFRD